MIFDTIIWYFKSLFLACGHILIGNLIIKVFTLSQQKSDSFFSPSEFFMDTAYIDGLSFFFICVNVVASKFNPVILYSNITTFDVVHAGWEMFCLL